MASASGFFGSGVLCWSCMFAVAGVHGVASSVPAWPWRGLRQLSQACATAVLWGCPLRARCTESLARVWEPVTCLGKTHCSSDWGWSLPCHVNIAGVFQGPARFALDCCYGDRLLRG